MISPCKYIVIIVVFIVQICHNAMREYDICCCGSRFLVKPLDRVL